MLVPRRSQLTMGKERARTVSRSGNISGSSEGNQRQWAADAAHCTPTLPSFSAGLNRDHLGPGFLGLRDVQLEHPMLHHGLRFGGFHRDRQPNPALERSGSNLAKQILALGVLN